MLAKSAQKKPVLKQGISAEKEFLCTKCYSNPPKENDMSFTQEETFQSGAVRSKSDQLDQTSCPGAERETGKLSIRQTQKATTMNPNLLLTT